MTKFICKWCTGPIVRKYGFTDPVVRRCVGTKRLGACCMRCLENGNMHFMDQPPACDSFELAKPSGVNILPKEGSAK